MEEWKTEEVARVLNEWNPLGEAAEKAKGPRWLQNGGDRHNRHLANSTESSTCCEIVMEVLSEAFSFYLLDLDVKDCLEPAAKISAILSRKG